PRESGTRGREGNEWWRSSLSDFLAALARGFGNPMHTIHDAAVGRYNDRKRQIRFVYQGHVLDDSAPSWGLVVAMPGLVELADATEWNLFARELVRELHHASSGLARRHASTFGLCVSPRRGQYDVTVLHRPVIALQHDRPRLPFIAVERPARDPGNGGATNHLMSVEHDGDDPPDQRDVVGLPLAGALRGILVGNQKPVDRAEAAGRRLAPGRILDLRLIAPAQIHAAVAARRIAKLEVQLEVAVGPVRHEIAAALRIGQHGGHGIPLVRTAYGMPAGEVRPIEELDRPSPLHRAAPLERRGAVRAPGELLAIRSNHRAGQCIAGKRAGELKGAVALLPLRRHGKPQGVVRKIEPRNGPHAPHRADELAHQHAVARPLDLEPGRGTTARVRDNREIPAPSDRRPYGLLGNQGDR